MFMFTFLIWNKFWRVLIKDSTAVRINDALCLKESKVTSQKGLCDTEINFFRDCTCSLDSSLWSLQYSPFTHRVYREEVLCSPNTCIWKKLGIYQYSKRSYLDRHCYERCRAETSSKSACYPTQTSNGAVHFLLLIIDPLLSIFVQIFVPPRAFGLSTFGEGLHGDWARAFTPAATHYWTVMLHIWFL